MNPKIANFQSGTTLGVIFLAGLCLYAAVAQDTEAPRDNSNALPPAAATNDFSAMPPEPLLDAVMWNIGKANTVLTKEQRQRFGSIANDVQKHYGDPPSADQIAKAELELVNRTVAILTPAQIAEGAQKGIGQGKKLLAEGSSTAVQDAKGTLQPK